jgi:hypothetical protein
MLPLVGSDRNNESYVLERMHGSPHENAVVSDVFIIIGPEIAPSLIRLSSFIGEYEPLRKSSVVTTHPTVHLGSWSGPARLP